MSSELINSILSVKRKVDTMSRQPRFEEIEDDDDPPELELPDMENSSSPLLSSNDLPQPSAGGMPRSANDAFKQQMISQQDMEQFRRWSCIYPVYFDASRTLQEGRRVPLHMAVKNPLAKDLAEAAASLGIQSVLEVGAEEPVYADCVAYEDTSQRLVQSRPYKVCVQTRIWSQSDTV